MEIIRLTVNYKRPAQDAAHRKPVSQRLNLGYPMTGKKRRKVTRMLRMRHKPGIIMASCRRKAAACAAAAFVDMQRKKTGSRFGQARYMDADQNAVAALVKLRAAPKARGIRPTLKPGHGIRPLQWKNHINHPRPSVCTSGPFCAGQENPRILAGYGDFWLRD